MIFGLVIIITVHARPGAQAKCGREPSEARPAAALELIIGSVWLAAGYAVVCNAEIVVI